MSRADHADWCNKDHAPGVTPCARLVPASTMSYPVLGADVLHGLEPGRRVADAQHDLWVKLEDGTWRCTRDRDDDTPYTLSAEHLDHVWGPLNIIPKEGI